jgi:hypothetical protein
MGNVPNGLAVWENVVLPKIKASGIGKKYDCVIGISGGIDSSFVAYIAKQYGLRTLLVHASTGFDSNISKRNLQRILEYTGFDIVYPTVDAEDFRSVQIAYLKASVLDADVPADYLIETFERKTALDNKVKYVLSGGNFYADAFMPYSWTYPNKQDYTNLININRAYGFCDLKSFPKFGAWQVLVARYYKKLIYATPLNYVGYTRPKAFKILADKLGYEDYGEKHFENIFTRFYQAYILPTKFGIDKRKANYSNYIRSGGLTKEQALNKLHEPAYPTEMFVADKAFILNKLKLSDKEFDDIMALPIVSHKHFGSDAWIYNIEKPYLLCRRLGKKLLRYIHVI